MIYTLRNDWIGNSGESWIDLLTFKVTETCVFVYSQSANANCKLLREDSYCYRIEKARRLFRRCLNDGFKLVDKAPALTRG